ncbi:DUF922 domain-containing protein [Sphingomonas qilianensis]|uniref:DUF922 domain-containing protein n=1 Tax=Sphingomonas qilianensis TaxID=1736690 RepID=A0ABU9XU42_9SPHN
MGRGLKAVAIVLALAAGAACAQASPFAAFPDVTISYYDVHGGDRAAIRAAMRKARPTDPNDGQRVDALTRVVLRWSWPIENGACRLPDAAVRFAATVTLPRLADPAIVAPRVRADWAAYLAQLVAHERTHLRHGYEGRDEILAVIKAATCDTANAAAQAALRRIQERDRMFDRATEHSKADAAF